MSIDTSSARPYDGHITLAVLVGHLVQLAMSRDWTQEAAGRDLLDAADGDPDLLGRARVQLLRTISPRSQVGRRALLTLAHAHAAAAALKPGTLEP